MSQPTKINPMDKTPFGKFFDALLAIRIRKIESEGFPDFIAH